MAHQIVVGYSSDSLESVEVDDAISPVHSSGRSNHSMSSHSNWAS
jgi:hypothetical protein